MPSRGQLTLTGTTSGTTGGGQRVGDAAGTVGAADTATSFGAVRATVEHLVRGDVTGAALGVDVAVLRRRGASRVDAGVIAEAGAVRGRAEQVEEVFAQRSLITGAQLVHEDHFGIRGTTATASCQHEEKGNGLKSHDQTIRHPTGEILFGGKPGCSARRNRHGRRDQRGTFHQIWQKSPTVT